MEITISTLGEIMAIFRRIPGEYRMVSDDNKNQLFLLFTDPQGFWHFRLLSPSRQLDFEAVQILNSVLEWHVKRIIETTTSKPADESSESLRQANSESLSLIVQALSDFGHFFGDKADEVQVALKTNTIYRNY